MATLWAKSEGQDVGNPLQWPRINVNLPPAMEPWAVAKTKHSKAGKTQRFEGNETATATDSFLVRWWGWWSLTLDMDEIFLHFPTAFPAPQIPLPARLPESPALDVRLMLTPTLWHFTAI